MIDMHPPTRILAIEPDPQSGAVLSRVLDKRVCADVVIVGDIDAALTSIAEQVPDLILTSTFLPPAALARLIDELRQLPDTTHTQIITTPHFLDAPASEASPDDSDRVLRFPRRRAERGPLPLRSSPPPHPGRTVSRTGGVAARGGPEQAATGCGSDH